MTEYLKPLSDLFNNDISWIRVGFSFLVFLSALIFKKIFDHYISKKMKALTEFTSFRYDDDFVHCITPPVSAFTFTVGLYLALKILGLPTEPYNIAKFLDEAFKVAAALIATWTVYRLVDVFAQLITDEILKKEEDEFIKKHFVPLITKALRVFIVVIGAMMIIQNLGYSITSLLTGLGIGGLAVALGAQESLANFFGSIALLSDRSFRIGDWITVGDVDGDVEELGFRSTRIRTWGKSLVTIPNKTLASSVIENWSAMPKRRVKQTLGLTYDTKPAHMREMVNGIKDILRNEPEVDQDFHMVKFTDFNAYSLDVLVYYFTKTTAWEKHLEIREKMNLSFMELAEKIGVSFAFPSRTLYFGDKESKSEYLPEPK